MVEDKNQPKWKIIKSNRSRKPQIKFSRHFICRVNINRADGNILMTPKTICWSDCRVGRFQFNVLECSNYNLHASCFFQSLLPQTQKRYLIVCLFTTAQFSRAFHAHSNFHNWLPESASELMLGTFIRSLFEQSSTFSIIQLNKFKNFYRGKPRINLIKRCKGNDWLNALALFLLPGA